MATSPSQQQSSSSIIKIFARPRPPRKALGPVSTTGKRIVQAEPNDSENIEFNSPHLVEDGLINNSKERWKFKFDKVEPDETLPIRSPRQQAIIECITLPKVIPENASQEEVFDTVAKDVVNNVLEGYNGTIFAYGQTGSGKTFTITGGAEKYADRGIIPRSIQHIFSSIAENRQYTYEVRVSYIEIYNESGYDLLDDSRDFKKLEDMPKVFLQESADGDITIGNVSSHACESEETALNHLFLGDTNKMIAETPSNPASSRSHALFSIDVLRKEPSGKVRKGKLFLVDLAGSERVSRTNISGQILREAKFINLSLHYLEQVIVALHEKALGKRSHIPYRNSMMTSLLRDSLGGNCKTTMVATVAPEEDLIDVKESIATCKFALRVAQISNNVSVNEEVDPQIIIAGLKAEIVQLKAELSLLRGESVGSDQALQEYEKEGCKAIVDAYVADKSPQATIVLNDLRKIQMCYSIMKTYIADSPKVPPTTKSSQVEVKLPSGNLLASDGLVLRDDMKKMRMQAIQRDTEIGVLLDMLKAKQSNQDVGLQAFSDDFARSTNPHVPEINRTTLRTTARSSVGSMPQLHKPKAEHPSRSSPSAPSSAVDNPHDPAAFEIFKASHKQYESMEQTKIELKKKYVTAKQLGVDASGWRDDVKNCKSEVERWGAIVASAANASSDSAESAELNLWTSKLHDSKQKYKDAYHALKDIKIEIEHIQHLMENAKTRMMKDYQIWYTEIYLPNQSGSKPPTSFQDTGSSTISRTAISPHTISHSPTLSSLTRLGIPSYPPSTLRNIDEHLSPTPPPPLLHTFHSPSPMPSTFTGTDEHASTLYSRSPIVPSAETPLSASPMPLGKSNVEDDVAEFYRTREKLLKDRLLT